MLAPTSLAVRSSSSAISRDLKYVWSSTLARRYERMRRCLPFSSVPVVCVAVVLILDST
jgi:hypothetical protein